MSLLFVLYRKFREEFVDRAVTWMFLPKNTQGTY